jgi:hypothetical protein
MTAAPADPVAKLLYDARIASEGAGLALGVCDVLKARELTRKSARLRREAEKLDPEHKSAGWSTELQ